MGRRLSISKGMKFGRLTIVEESFTSKRRRRFLCQCDCGANLVVELSSLTTGNTKSCGCLQKEITAQMSTKHGHNRRGKRHRLYSIWVHMRDRCLNPEDALYKYYGARGITVCAEWLDYPTFYSWAVSKGYAENLTLDRVENNKGYSPDNCRWATSTEQNSNRRNNVLLTHNGETKTLQQWARDLGISRGALRDRLKHGLSVEEALTMPKLTKRRWLCPGSKTNRPTVNKKEA